MQVKQNDILLADLCLHHNVVTGSAKHYLFDDYTDELREAWEKLGNRIEVILSADNVVNFEKVSA